MLLHVAQVLLPPLLSAVLWLSPTVNLASSGTASNTGSTDILEVIKVYGKLAGPSCYGRIAPRGSSCQIMESELKQILLRQDASISRDVFGERLEQANFQWPLKPYGVEKSNDKTALMNKGAETRLYMDELIASGLYDARNPTGPLPTSLRPQLNLLLQTQGLEEKTTDRVYDILRRGSGEITAAKIHDLMSENNGALDYYDFVRLLGADTVSWR